MTDFAPAIGEPPAIQFISPDRLKVDPSYQRSLDGRASQKLVEAIAAKWDWRLCLPLLVAARDRDLYIIDGQHRWAAARARGDIGFLPCAVGQYDGAAEEAALFVAANRRRVAVNRLDLFRAALAAGDEATATIDTMLAAAGLTIAEHTSGKGLKSGQIGSTAVLYKALREKGSASLGEVVAILGSAFADQRIGYSGVIIGALVQINPAALGEADRARLLTVLRSKSADEWAAIPAVRRAQGGTVRATQLFFAVREAMGKAHCPPPSMPSTKPALPTRPLTGKAGGFAAPPPPAWPTWCDQCDRKVTEPEAARCADRFCKSRAA